MRTWLRPVKVSRRHAMDSITGYRSIEEYVTAKATMERLRKADTASLSEKLTLCIGHPYVFVPNIEVTDGLANMSVGKIPFVQHNIHSRVLQVWLEFPYGTGIVARSKSRHLRKDESAILPTWVSAELVTYGFHLKGKGIAHIVLKRRPFPIAQATAVIITPTEEPTARSLWSKPNPTCRNRCT